MALWIFVLAVLIPVVVIGFLASKLIKYNAKKVRKERKGAKKQVRKETAAVNAKVAAEAAAAAATASETETPSDADAAKKTE
jgi:hypothetical protein